MRTIILSLLGLGFAAMVTRKPVAYRVDNVNATIGTITIEWKCITGRMGMEFRCNVQCGLPVTCGYLPETPDVVHLADNKRYAN